MAAYSGGQSSIGAATHSGRSSGPRELCGHHRMGPCGTAQPRQNTAQGSCVQCEMTRLDENRGTVAEVPIEPTHEEEVVVVPPSALMSALSSLRHVRTNQAGRAVVFINSRWCGARGRLHTTCSAGPVGNANTWELDYGAWGRGLGITHSSRPRHYVRRSPPHCTQGSSQRTPAGNSEQAKGFHCAVVGCYCDERQVV